VRSEKRSKWGVNFWRVRKCGIFDLGFEGCDFCRHFGRFEREKLRGDSTGKDKEGGGNN
jgi:hypothetical protein